jgi:hypothetical protein
MVNEMAIMFCWVLLILSCLLWFCFITEELPLCCWVSLLLSFVVAGFPAATYIYCWFLSSSLVRCLIGCGLSFLIYSDWLFFLSGYFRHHQLWIGFSLNLCFCFIFLVFHGLFLQGACSLLWTRIDVFFWLVSLFIWLAYIQSLFS